MNDKVIKFFDSLQDTVKQDLDKLKKLNYLDEDYTVSRNKQLKKNLVAYGKDLIEFTKNPIDYINQMHEDDYVHDVLMINGQLYFVYEDEKLDVQSMTEEEKENELEQFCNPINEDDYLDDEEGDVKTQLTYKIFENSMKLMEKYGMSPLHG